MFGNKTHNTFTRLAAGTALSAFLFAAGPAIADQTSSNDNDEDFVIRLHGMLNENKSEVIIRSLRGFAAIDPEKEITLYINSLGGLVNEAFAIYDTIRDIPNDIRTVCEGQAMSSAMLLLTAGTPGKRQALPNCQIMAHQSSVGVRGHIEDNRLNMEFNQSLNERFVQIIADHSGWEVDTLTNIISNDVFLTAAEGQDMNFIDEIVPPTKPLPATTIKTQDDLPDWFCEGERAQIMRVCVTP